MAIELLVNGSIVHLRLRFPIFRCAIVHGMRSSSPGPRTLNIYICTLALALYMPVGPIAAKLVHILHVLGVSAGGCAALSCARAAVARARVAQNKHVFIAAYVLNLPRGGIPAMPGPGIFSWSVCVYHSDEFTRNHHSCYPIKW